MLIDGVILHADCLAAMRDMPDECVDLIYADPPFGTGRDFGAYSDRWAWDEARLQDAAEYRGAVSGADAVIAVAEGAGLGAYIAFIGARAVEMKRILKHTGSIYVHCDWHASHYIKVEMDKIFGYENLRNEIIWAYQRWTGGTSHFQRMHDVLLFYSKSDNYTFNRQYEAYSNKSKHKGRRFSKIDSAGNLHQSYTEDTSRQKSMRDVWDVSYLNSQAKERIGYPTQKPMALLERIIKASSNPGDLALDPFCGSGTSLAAAQALGRRWLGIDSSADAVAISRARLGLC